MTESLLRLYVQTRKTGQCASAECLRAIDWYTTLNDRAMPMNAGATPIRTETDPTTGYLVGLFSSADSHWSSCPARARFSRPWSRTRRQR